MANMSASILRNLVSSVFGVKATEIVLSGEIAPDFKCLSFTGHSWARMKDVIKIWGFDPINGFKELKVPSYYSNNGDSVGDEACTLADIASGNEIFFVVFNDYESQDFQDHKSWKLYKAPDFKSHWAKINSDDLVRWESWINE